LVAAPAVLLVRAAAHLDEHVQAQSCPFGAVAKEGNLGVRILTAASDKRRR
jgi:hypothetical protein